MQDLTPGARGFHALNVECPAKIIDKFVRQAFGSPHLMQLFCQRACLGNDIREGSSNLQSIQIDNDLSFFGGISKETSKLAFDRLATGPRQRTDRIPREFADGTTGDIYIAILKAIARTGPGTSLSYEDIRGRLREIMAGDIPQMHEVSRVLMKMTDIARQKIEGEPVLEWDDDAKMLHIADLYFAFYLKRGELVRPGSGLEL